ncbi:hypothetical protein WGT02_17240 [Rhizobium sp. T1470]|uniref:hypothetical protein n=1 Tax=unclassified Rhizobium TaxID=2613769 RepID=UPI001AAF8A33|nr:hypothetical protein [Rhizobium sp. T1473]MCA0802929.1 hypothetical protein [Rhizobium sp. T1473]
MAVSLSGRPQAPPSLMLIECDSCLDVAKQGRWPSFTYAIANLRSRRSAAQACLSSRKPADRDHCISDNPLDFYFKRLPIEIANANRLQFPKPSEISARIPVRHFGRSCGIWEGAYCASANA